MQIVPMHEQAIAEDGSVWNIFRVHGPGDYWTAIIVRMTEDVPNPKDSIYRTPARTVWYGSRLDKNTVMTDPLRWIENFIREQTAIAPLLK